MKFILLSSILASVLFLGSFSAYSLPTPSTDRQESAFVPENIQLSWVNSDANKLMSFYSQQANWWQDKNCIHSGGCVGTEQSVWVWANAVYVMANYQSLTADTRYQSLIKRVYVKNWKNIYPKKFFDDELWWAIALLRVYEVTQDHDALEKAEKLVAFAKVRGQQDVCYGTGGIYWSLEKGEVGTIANMLYIIANAKLYQITHQLNYRQQANSTWNWYRRSGLLRTNYTVFDHYAVKDGRCGEISHWPFTYNIGVLLTALEVLASINKDNAFLRYGSAVARASIREFTHNGIITEYCDDVFECAKNVYLFKGIYAFELARFAMLSDDASLKYQVQVLLAKNLLQIKRVQGKDALYAFDWSLPINYSRRDKAYNPADILSHLSLVYLELGNLLLIKSVKI